MGKKSRQKAAIRAAQGTSTSVVDAEIPVVSGRADCPCGSGRRYRLCHGRPAVTQTVSTRTFEGLNNECEWVALREILSAATATVPLRPDVAKSTGVKTVTIASILPMAWPGMHRNDGVRFVAMQSAQPTSNPRASAALALQQVLNNEPGMPVESVSGQGPALEELIDVTAPFTVEVHDTFDFWMAEDVERTSEVLASLEQANQAVAPTRRMQGEHAAYWTQLGERTQLRWVMPWDEEPLLDAFARLSAAGQLLPMEGAKFLGTFRAHGLVVPVWDVPQACTAEELQPHFDALLKRCQDALAVTSPLSTAERQARAGVASRQITLR